MFRRLPRLVLLCALFLTALFLRFTWAREITPVLNTREVETYDFVEVTLHISQPEASNPFAEVQVSGSFGKKGGPQKEVI